MFENAARLIIYSGHLFKLWDLNSIQQLAQQSMTMMAMDVTAKMMDQLNSRTKLPQNDMLPGLKVCPSCSWQHCRPVFIERRRYQVDCAKSPPIALVHSINRKESGQFPEKFSYQKSLENLKSYCETLPSNLKEADSFILEMAQTRPEEFIGSSSEVHLHLYLYQFFLFVFVSVFEFVFVSEREQPDDCFVAWSEELNF